MIDQLPFGFDVQQPKPLLRAEPAPDGPEEWRSCPGFEGYQVSSLGRFRNLKTRRELGGTKHTSGYINIGLNVNGKVNTKLAHRLVALAFLPRAGASQIVNHKNLIRTDNRASNLEWCDQSHNMKHSWESRRTDFSTSATPG